MKINELDMGWLRGEGGSELQFYVTFFRLGAKSMEGGGMKGIKCKWGQEEM